MIPQDVIDSIIEEAMGEDEFKSTTPKMRKILTVIANLTYRVFPEKIEREAFMIHITSMLADKMYLPDTPCEMPGKDLEAEKHLREVLGIVTGRRI